MEGVNVDDVAKKRFDYCCVMQLNPGCYTLKTILALNIVNRVYFQCSFGNISTVG